MAGEHKAVLDSPQFKSLVQRKWTISLILTAVMLLIYYGFILVLAFSKETLAAKIGEHVTVGLPVGLFVIVISWVLTGVYVAWANTSYDQSVKDITESMRRSS